MAVYRLKPGHTRTFLFGVARRPGEPVQVGDLAALDKAERETLDAHFERVDIPSGKAGPQAGGAKPPVLRNGLTEEQARQKLQSAGVTFAENVKGDALADLFDQAFSGPPDGSEPPAFGNPGKPPDEIGADGASGAGDKAAPAGKKQK